MKRKITIAGAGLVGSLWAVLLKKRGYDVTVYEKRSDIRKGSAEGERSINLIITSRGLNGLKQAGLLQAATDLSVPVYGRMIHSRSSELTYQPYGQENEFNLSISRTALNQFLLNAAEKAGAKILFEHDLETLDLEKKIAIFKNCGRQVDVAYDVLFGTDGAGSPVRKTLVESEPQQFQDRIDWLEADYLELFLPAGENRKSVIEKNALHIWPRGSYMMMALANLDGSFTVTLYLPKSDEIARQIGSPYSFESITSEAQAHSLFEKEFPDAISLMPTFVEDFLKNPKGKLGTVRCSKWSYHDSVALMGDAAHAVVPFFGQGMNCGFEDCTQLLNILDETHDNWEIALKKYDEIRRPNGNAIADMAIENWTEMRDKVGDWKFLLRKKVESILEKEFPKMFKSRYGMVTYTLIPYALAQEAGRIQDHLLDKLCEGLSTADELSLTNAERILKSEFVPFLEKNQIELSC